MRSRTNYTISSGQVYAWARDVLIEAKLVRDHGWKCLASVVLGIILRAAARCISIHAVCRDLAKAPSDQAVRTALEEGLPKTLPVLEWRLNDALTALMPKRMLRRRWNVAIDWHLQPYYGQPFESRNELYPGPPKHGTTTFHAYATACIVEYGRRYTVALTSVRRGESKVCVLRRLVATIRQKGLKIRCVLLDRAFFNSAVVAFLQEEELPFVMPVVIRGPAPKQGRKSTGLRWIRRQPAGWYPYLMHHKDRVLKISICVGYRGGRRKDGKQRHRKLLFAAWGVRGSPTEIRQLYRRRFGIETSFRQMQQARIATCTRNPRLRLFFVAVALILRNLWVWIHHVHLAERTGQRLTVHLKLLRFQSMLDWIEREIIALFHDGTTAYVAQPP